MDFCPAASKRLDLQGFLSESRRLRGVMSPWKLLDCLPGWAYSNKSKPNLLFIQEKTSLFALKRLFLMRPLSP